MWLAESSRVRTRARRLTKNASVTLVHTPMQLQEAVKRGDEHIEIREHLDLSRTPPLTDFFLGPLPPSVKSIRVGCSDPRYTPEFAAGQLDMPLCAWRHACFVLQNPCCCCLVFEDLPLWAWCPEANSTFHGGTGLRCPSGRATASYKSAQKLPAAFVQVGTSTARAGRQCMPEGACECRAIVRAPQRI